MGKYYFEPRHDKTNIVRLRPAWILIRLRGFAVSFSTCNRVVKQTAGILSINEPRHDKTNIVGLRPAWIQTSCSFIDKIPA
jgi:hypothetical protein